VVDEKKGQRKDSVERVYREEKKKEFSLYREMIRWNRFGVGGGKRERG
jgi:hypothetical protein